MDTGIREMTFLSGMFLVFVAGTIVAYFAVPLRVRWMVLLAASIVFYVSSGIIKLPFLLAATLAAYGAARWMEQVYAVQDNWIRENAPDAAEKKKRIIQGKKKCRRILAAALVFIIGILVYCKAGARLIGAFGRIFAGGDFEWGHVIVPLGISYYTFSTVGYLADVYWRKDKAEKNFLKFLLFVCWFPHILQGPIARHKKLAAQLNEGHPFDYQRLCYGLQLALWGYFKKMVIADRLVIFVNTVFDNYMDYSGIIFIIAAMFSSIQLYCDFSGCMDIAAGISQIFGVELEKNFDHPFFSRSAAEFWRRWHITLGAWFKDYVYMPLVISPKVINLAKNIKKVFGNRAGKAAMSIIPLGCVWILTGLWHGTGYNYIAWGIYWGTIIILSSVFAPEIRRFTAFLRINTETQSWRAVQMVRTFLLFSFGRLITVPGHLRTTWDILKKIVAKHDIWTLVDGSVYKYGLDRQDFLLVAVSLLILWCVSRQQEKNESVRDKIAGYNSVIRWGIYYIAVFAIVIFGIYGAGYDSSAFLYMNY